ncbi:hypothetical protein EDB85DRAFT_2151047 [Lactarius pseudohatsudake]|nr:hypothetical protein EDB85DRAFT_2151047 [Lactarius pseudohatsudake]
MSLRIDSSLNVDLNRFLAFSPLPLYYSFHPLLSTQRQRGPQHHLGARHNTSKRSTKTTLCAPVTVMQLYVVPDDVAACGSAMQTTSRVGSQSRERAGRLQPQVPDMTTPIPLLRAASRDISNHDSHDDPAAAGTPATPTAMRTPATMETVTATAMMTTPLRMRPRAQ